MCREINVDDALAAIDDNAETRHLQEYPTAEEEVAPWRDALRQGLLCDDDQLDSLEVLFLT